MTFNCCAPGGCFYADTVSGLNNIDTVKVICSNELCHQSGIMHDACFEAFEDSVLDFLKARGRLRAAQERQFLQNLWTKSVFDLPYPILDCLCGSGKLRKDIKSVITTTNTTGLQYNSIISHSSTSSSAVSSKRKRKKPKNGTKQALVIGLPHFNEHSATTLASSNSPHQNSSLIRRSDAQNVPPRNRTNSISSNTSGSSFTSSSGGELTSGSSPTSSSEGLSRRNTGNLQQNRSRHDSGGSIFQRRLDYSSFNVLPRHKINSYHIKMEDECSIGNDETRIFILSSFATNKMNKVPCVMCKSVLHIFDRYPLIDGTFFLSPRQHNKCCIPVKTDGKLNYLTAICMGCLEGWTSISCRFCSKGWSGSHLILGTMYSYDIFAATPCCQEKLKCSNCAQLVIHPGQRFNFFSDYSQIVSCPSCGSQDAHFVKSLSFYFRSEENKGKLQLQQQNVHQLSLQQQFVSGNDRAQFAVSDRGHRVNSA
ncbi:headcase protein [Lepeophtheirus salmonis]|uniref:headcase protein n=1 Tax=Lepeophtheirus salmonis TaxID=72036 RepID=UPI001AEB1C8E|nr:headcase protein homolog [Lepeophtheirus salmonis]XP_040572114.1 headcase protein homolog [Lepeophtheirus salmonis]